MRHGRRAVAECGKLVRRLVGQPFRSISIKTNGALDVRLYAKNRMAPY